MTDINNFPINFVAMIERIKEADRRFKAKPSIENLSKFYEERLYGYAYISGMARPLVDKHGTESEKARYDILTKALTGEYPEGL